MIKHDPTSNCLIIPLDDIVCGDARVWGYNTDDRYSRVEVQFDGTMQAHYLSHLTSLETEISDDVKMAVKPLIQELKDTTNDYEIYEQTKKVLEWLQ